MDSLRIPEGFPEGEKDKEDWKREKTGLGTAWQCSMEFFRKALAVSLGIPRESLDVLRDS